MRRRRQLLVVALAALLGACSAIDDFGKFTFVDDAGTSGSSDMSNLPGFGQACTDSCAQPVPARPLTCVHMIGNRSVMNGICTRTCTVALGVAACNDFSDAECVTVESTDLCLPRCDPSVGRNCRTGFSCCDNHNVVTVAGACAPPTTDLCH